LGIDEVDAQARVDDGARADLAVEARRPARGVAALAHRERAAAERARLWLDDGRALVLERVPVAAAAARGRRLVVAVLAVVDERALAAVLDGGRGHRRRGRSGDGRSGRATAADGRRRAGRHARRLLGWD